MPAKKTKCASIAHPNTRTHAHTHAHAHAHAHTHLISGYDKLVLLGVIRHGTAVDVAANFIQSNLKHKQQNTAAAAAASLQTVLRP